MGNAQTKKPVTLEYAIRSFVGYLEGTQKAAHTVKNYRCDLHSFREFLQKGLGSDPVHLSEITQADVEKFNFYLRSKGLKTNSRRRKILTIRRLLRYLNQRNKLSLDMGRKIPAPHKVERIPFSVAMADLLPRIKALPSETELSARNRILLWTMAESGCLVSEATKIRFEDWLPGPNGSALLTFSGKATRQVPVSQELYQAVRALKDLSGAGRAERAQHGSWLFFGFNKFGPLGGAITSRGVELLVRSYASQLGVDELTPRIFRHSAVRQWYADGISKDEIQKRLGLKTKYAFRVYEPMFRSSSKATSSS